MGKEHMAGTFIYLEVNSHFFYTGSDGI